jgi:glycosyltransferase involved in cell wall biosynthesis
MSETKVALIQIVKGSDDEADHLKRCLTNVSPYVDGIFLNINSKKGHKPSAKVVRVSERFTKNIIFTEWNDDFAEARNRNLAQVPSDYTDVIWLDTDDTIDKPEKIRQVAEKSQHDAVMVDYLYDQDSEGNPVTVHMVARMFKAGRSRHDGEKYRNNRTQPDELHVPYIPAISRCLFRLGRVLS